MAERDEGPVGGLVDAGFPHELDFSVREYSQHLRQDVQTYLQEWIQSGTLDPENAGRLLALGGLSNTLPRVQHERLLDICGDHTGGEPVPGRIIAPALRVRHDFREVDHVMAQPASAAPWLQYAVFCVEEDGPPKEAVVARSDQSPIAIQPFDRTLVSFHPKSPRLFTEADYDILTKPETGHRPRGVAEALRRAIALSHFDEEISEETPRHVLRHFSLLVPFLYPRR